MIYPIPIYKYNWHVFLKSEYKYKYHKIYIYFGYILPKIRKIYVSWRVSVNPLGNVHFEIKFCTRYKLLTCWEYNSVKLYIKGWVFALWAHGSVTYIFYFYIHIGYKLPTFGEYMSVGWYWIYPANYWRIYIVSWKVSAPGPNSPGPNCPPWKSGQLGPGAQLSGAQLSALKKWTVGPRTVGPRGPTVRGPIVRLEKVDIWDPDSWAPGPNCPGPNCPPR